MKNQVTSQEIQNTLEIAKYSPDLITGKILDLVTKSSQGELSYHDANNPAIFLLEASATMASFCLTNTDNRHHELYPKLAVNESQLYHHMSSRDYIGRFATPSHAEFQIFLNKQSVYNAAVPVVNQTGLKKLVFPRGTAFVVDDYTFTLLYPIEIRITTHGDIQILYDVSKPDPIQTLESNIVEWDIITNPMGSESGSTIEYLVIKPIVKQVKSEYWIGSVSDQLGNFKKKILLVDEYVHARVYIVNPENEIIEMETTHSDLVFDSEKPTALLQLTEDNTLFVTIPDIYNRLRKINGRIDIEVFTTKGPIELDLLNYSSSNRIVMDMDKITDVLELDVLNNPYINGVKDLNGITVVSSSKTTGGSHKLSFEELRERVINNTYYVDRPISHSELKNNSIINGYEITNSIDFVTDRLFKLTKQLPAPRQSLYYNYLDTLHTEPPFVTGAPCSIETIRTTLESLGQHQSVRDHHNGRYTITPDVLFKTKDGKTSLVPHADVPKVINGNTDNFLQDINRLEYGYTPFHYCVDSTDNRFEIRPYYMDNPQYISQRFIKNNDTSQLMVSASNNITVLRSPILDNKNNALPVTTHEGYVILVRTKNGDSYRKLPPENLIAQLAFNPTGEKDLTYVNGRLLRRDEDGDDLWEFKIVTDFDFTNTDELVVKNFNMYTREQRKDKMKLTTDFQLLFGVYDYDVDGLRVDEVDDILGKHLLDGTRKVVGLSQTSIKLKFGVALTHFWRNARSLMGDNVYKRYSEDIIATYPEHVYQYDENTGLPVFIGEEGNETPVVLHRKGEIIYDEHQQPVIKHRKGEIMIGSDSLPILAESRKVVRFIDIFLIDGIYKFATNESDKRYLKTIPEDIILYLEQDVKPMSKRLLENSKLFFTPKRTMGTTKLNVNNGEERTVLNRIPFNVTYYLTTIGYNDSNLRRVIKHMTHKVINEVIQMKSVSVDDLAYRLRKEAGNEVLSVKVSGIGEDEDIQTYTILDNSSGCSVKRKLRLESNGEYRVVEDITIDFINHQSKHLELYR